VPIDEPETGLVINYHFLWARQHEQGEESGRKARPVCVVVPLRMQAGTVVLFPLTTQRPGPDRVAIEVPETERRRLKLRGHGSSWIILDEANSDRMPGTYHLEPISYDPLVVSYGRFSEAFIQLIVRTVATALRAGKVTLVPRKR
jgi:hypothetical protein